jgi:hypothetical protein
MDTSFAPEMDSIFNQINRSSVVTGKQGAELVSN